MDENTQIMIISVIIFFGVTFLAIFEKLSGESYWAFILGIIFTRLILLTEKKEIKE